MSDQTTMAEVQTLGNNPGVVAEVVCRVVFAVLANVAIWVPFRHLTKNGEFAASLFCGVVMVMNFINIINSLLWRDDDTSKWYDGHVYCDIVGYINFPFQTLYSACILCIMRHLALQLSMMRASALTKSEKMRRNIIQGLIMIPIPVVQVALTYPLLSERYRIITWMGCRLPMDSNPLDFVFFTLPVPIFVLGACYYAIVTWLRFRKVAKDTAAALSSNTTAASRSHRAKRKLFLMTSAVLVPFAPVQLAFFAWNISRAGAKIFKPYDFHAIHNPPERWNKIRYITTDMLGFADLHLNYIPIITVIPIFIYFGTTKEAINTWRRYLLFIGLGKVFDSLNTEYDPDRRKTKNATSRYLMGTWGKSWGRDKTTVPSTTDPKSSLGREITLSSNLSSNRDQQQELDQLPVLSPLSPLSVPHQFTDKNDSYGVPLERSSHPSSSRTPATDAAHAIPKIPARSSQQQQQQPPRVWTDSPLRDDDDEPIIIPPRNPFLFRTMLATPPIKIPPFPFAKFGFGRSKPDTNINTTAQNPSTPLQSITVVRSMSTASRPREQRGRQPSNDATNNPISSSPANHNSSTRPHNRHSSVSWEHSPAGSTVETKVWSDDQQELIHAHNEEQVSAAAARMRSSSPRAVHVHTHFATVSSPSSEKFGPGQAF